MSYQYNKHIFSGKAYVAEEDFDCIFDMQKKKYEEFMKDKNEQIALAKKMLTKEKKENAENLEERNKFLDELEEMEDKFTTERKENNENIIDRNKFLDKFEEMKKKYDMLKEKSGYESASEDEDDEEIDVVKFKNKKDGVDYLRGSDGVIYDEKTQKPVGKWDAKTETVIFDKVEPVKLKPVVITEAQEEEVKLEVEEVKLEVEEFVKPSRVGRLKWKNQGFFVDDDGNIYKNITYCDVAPPIGKWNPETKKCSWYVKMLFPDNSLDAVALD